MITTSEITHISPNSSWTCSSTMKNITIKFTKYGCKNCILMELTLLQMLLSNPANIVTIFMVVPLVLWFVQQGSLHNRKFYSQRKWWHHYNFYFKFAHLEHFPSCTCSTYKLNYHLKSEEWWFTLSWTINEQTSPLGLLPEHELNSASPDQVAMAITGLFTGKTEYFNGEFYSLNYIDTTVILIKIIHFISYAKHNVYCFWHQDNSSFGIEYRFEIANWILCTIFAIYKSNWSSFYFCENKMNCSYFTFVHWNQISKLKLSLFLWQFLMLHIFSEQ